jgi:hypothetical protein
MAADGSSAMGGGGMPMGEPIGGELGTEDLGMGEENDLLEGPMGSIDLDELGSEGEESEEEIAAEETEEIETL